MTKRQALEYFEYAFTIGSLWLYGGGPLQLILTGGASEGDGGGGATEPDFAIIRLLCMVTYVVFGLLVLYRWKRSLYGAYKGRVVLTLTALAVLSYFWSDYPQVTMSRSIALIGTSIFGVYLGTRYTLRQQIKIFAITYGIMILLSLAFIFGIPRYGIMGGIHAGAWRGIFVHKNVMGRAMVFASMGFLTLASMKQEHRRIPLIFLGLCIFLILMARSTTALGNVFFLTVAFYVLRTARWRYDVRLLTLIVGLLVGGTLYGLVMANIETVLGAFGKDTELSGRVDLWPMCVNMIERRPFFGYAYQGFWNGWNSAAGEIWRAYGWNAPHCHNGFLDLTLDLGLVGTSIFLFEAVMILLLAVIRLQRTHAFEHAFCAMVPLFFLLYNMTESSILGRNSLFWVIFIAVSISVRIPIPLPEKPVSEEPPARSPLLLNQQFNS